NQAAFIAYTPLNYEHTSAAYSYRSIAGTNLNLGYSYSAGGVEPPFPIHFGGGTFTRLWAASGGLISLREQFTSTYPTPLPYGQNEVIIAPLMRWLYPNAGTGHNVFWDVTGVSPHRELVVEWRDVSTYYPSDTSSTVRFQVVFFEDKSDVLFNYADVSTGSG